MSRIKRVAVICASMLIGSAYAYNKEVTQELQDKINATQSELALANPVFLKEIEQLIIKKGDPNVAYKGNPSATLVLVLCILPFIDDSIDIAAVEHTLKVALEHGGNANAREERAPALQYAMAGSPGMVKLLIDHGADLTIKNKDGDTPLAIVEKEIQGRTEGLAYLQQKEIPKIRKNIARMRQNLDVLISMSDQVGIARAKMIKPTAGYNQQATQQLQEKLSTLKSDEDINSEFLKAVIQFIEKGANPNITLPGVSDGWLLLVLLKVPYQNADIDFALLEKAIGSALRAGANPNVRDGEDSATATSGDTALGYAIEYGSANMVKLFIEYGSDPLVKDRSNRNYITRLEQQLKEQNEWLQRMTQKDVSDLQKKIRHLQQVRDVIQQALRAQKK